MNPTDLIAFTPSILRERSLSAEEAAVVAKTAEQMRALGYDRVKIDQNGSVYGVVEGNLPGPTLLFDAHADTVVATPAAAAQVTICTLPCVDTRAAALACR